MNDKVSLSLLCLLTQRHSLTTIFYGSGQCKALLLPYI